MQIKRSRLQYWLVILALALTAPQTIAKDITKAQRDAYEARETFNDNKSHYKNISAQVAQQEKRVTEAQNRLEQLRSEQADAKNKLEQSKIDLDQKVNILNEAWRNRK